MFREAYPSLTRRTTRTCQRVVGEIFWKSDRADQQGNTEVLRDSAPAAGQAEDDEDVQVFGSTGVPLFRDQAVDLSVHDSFNYVFKLKKKRMVKMWRDLEEHGEVTYQNVAFTHLSVVRYYDLSDYIPIFFNWKKYSDYEASKEPSRVVCYKTSEAGEWCLRPVEGGEGKTVVTIYDEKWQVRESIVQVSSDDTYLQEQLMKIGFHFVGEAEMDLKAVEGSTMMGRHELTPKDDLGTTIPHAVLVFRWGLLCTLESGMAESGVGDRPSTPPATPVTTSAAELPQVAVVTNPTDPKDPTLPPPGKKAKTGDRYFISKGS